MQNVIEYFLYYTIYAFFGYICEVVYVAICTKKITNRGYLYGPMVPIYGYGAIGVILALSWAKNMGYWFSPILVFVLGFLLTTTLEYLVSFFMEIIFHMRWWDYSDKFLNINGRVCLRNSSMFGALVLIVLYLLHPYVVTYFVSLLEGLGKTWFYVIVITIFSLQVVDTVLSTIKHVNVSKIIRKLQAMASQVSIEINKASEMAKNGITNIKVNATEKMQQLKDYLANTKVIKALFRQEEQFPTSKVMAPKSHTRLTFSEFINKIKDKIQGE